MSIQNPKIQFLVKTYLYVNTGFWPLALMYKEAYDITPLKVEGHIWGLFLGWVLNIGLFMSLTSFGLKWKKVTLSFFPLALLS